jgi:LysR family transcriptional regulator, mexEF-oprN operon transcriptional activator
MHQNYERDLDLNLLRVFAVVAESGSVTEAASRLYLTQPAVSAALRRLSSAVKAPLWVRQGRSLRLNARGKQLHGAISRHLGPLIEATLAAPRFEPHTSDRTWRLGLSDSAEVWLLPRLLRWFGEVAPKMRVVVVPVQFRTIAAALAEGLDAAVTVADDLPSSIRRTALYRGTFKCLYDPRVLRFRRMTEAVYFAQDHIVVSYNGDLRGIVEDMFGKTRNVRCSVPGFSNLGALIEGTALLGTVPELVAKQILEQHPALKTAPVPLPLEGAAIELLWPATQDDDEAGRWFRNKLIAMAGER